MVSDEANGWQERRLYSVWHVNCYQLKKSYQSKCLFFCRYKCYSSVKKYFGF
jgi:hypothetical protein